jgi:hypothetical protein
MPLSAGIRKAFDNVPLSRVRRILAGGAVCAVPAEDALYLFARNFEEMILVEPRFRPGGKVALTYALRDDAALADVLGRLAMPTGKSPKQGNRRGHRRRLGRARGPA